METLINEKQEFGREYKFIFYTLICNRWRNFESLTATMLPSLLVGDI